MAQAYEVMTLMGERRMKTMDEISVNYELNELGI